MPKRKKYSRIHPDDLLRYISGEMSDRERHAMEKEMQQDPFAADALEGLSVPGAAEARDDLSKLKARLNRRVGARNSAIWIRVAASVAVIVTLGTLYFTVFSDRPGRMDRMVAESETEDLKPPSGEAVESPSGETVESPSGEAGKVQAESDEMKTVIREEAGRGRIEPSVPEERAKTSGPGTPSGVELSIAEPSAEEESTDTELTVADEAVLAEKSVGRKDTESTREIAGPEMATEKLAVKGVAGETLTGESITAEEIAGPALKRQAEKGPQTAQPSALTVPDIIPAMPVGGWEMFNRYVEVNLRLPTGDSIPSAGVVELSFYLDAQGHPRNINVEKSPGDVFSREAERLLRDGPAWTPVFRNGEPSEEKIHVPIDFGNK
jgi:hypothetical protein